jgi:hypothetical protein
MKKLIGTITDIDDHDGYMISFNVINHKDEKVYFVNFDEDLIINEFGDNYDISDLDEKYKGKDLYVDFGIRERVGEKDIKEVINLILSIEEHYK